MNLVKWKPFGELEQFRTEMDNLFKGFFGEGAFAPAFARECTSSEDIPETKDAVIVKAELPGLEPKVIYTVVNFRELSRVK